jgi:hypothetical protein
VHELLTSNHETLKGGHLERKLRNSTKSTLLNARKTANVGKDANGRGEEGSVGESTTLEDAENDDEEDEGSEDTEEPESIAPSGKIVRGKGKGKGKGVRRGPVNKRLVIESFDEVVDNHRAGRNAVTNSSGNTLKRRKRSFSKVIAETPLHKESAIDEIKDEEIRPRKKMQRRLSYGAKPTTPRIDEVDESALDDEEEATADEYGAVALISDSDGSESDIQRVETEMIINSEEENDEATPTPRETRPRASRLFVPPPTPDYEAMIKHLDIDIEEDLFCNSIYFDTPMTRAFNEYRSIFDTDPFQSEQNDEVNDSGDSDSSVIRKGVRFSSTTTTSSSSSDDEAFPDLFMDQNDPTIRPLLEAEDEGNDSDPFAWAYFGSTKVKDNEEAAEEPSSPSSGYETDDGGETTDDDLPPVKHTDPKSCLRSPGVSTRSSTALSKKSFRGPTLGNWIADPTKPISIFDSTGKRLLILPVRKPSTHNQYGSIGSTNSSTMTSPQTPFASLMDDSEADRSDYSCSQDVGATVMFGSTNLMMGGLLHGPSNAGMFGNQILGPPEAFYPYMSVGSNGVVLDTPFGCDDESDEEVFSIHDFIDFGNGDNPSDVEDEGLTTMEPPSPITATASSPPTSPTADQLITHFDKGIVGSFKRNQTHHRQRLSRDPRIDSPATYGKILKGRSISNGSLSPERRRRSDSLIGHKAKFNRSPMGIGAKKKAMRAPGRPEGRYSR